MLRHLYSIFCDTVRQEDTGKVIFVGVYTGDIVLHQLPTTFSVQIWLDMETSDFQPESFSLRVVHQPGDRVIGEIEASAEPILDAPSQKQIQFTLPPLIVTAEQDGALELQLRQDDGDWETVTNKRIIYAPTAKQAAPQKSADV